MSAAASWTKPVKTRLWQISLTVPVKAEEAAAALLEKIFGKVPVIYTDAETPMAAVSVYCPKLPRPEGDLGAWLRAGLKQIQSCGLDIGAARVAMRKVRGEAWAESWKKHFQPVEIARTLLIKPSWSRRRPRAGQAVVVLDPGLSFGTGQHPTTAFCLEQLVACRQIGQARSCLDIGTGSGILAIAAAKLGYQPVHAFDLDPVAVRVAKANALQNQVEKRIRIFRQDLTRLPLRSVGTFDVVCANLIYDLLVGQSKRILNRLQPNSTLILAGILKTQLAQVRQVYAAAGLKMIATRTEKEWRSGAFAFQR